MMLEQVLILIWIYSFVFNIDYVYDFYMKNSSYFPNFDSIGLVVVMFSISPVLFYLKRADSA